MDNATYRTILLPIDGSEASRLAVPYVEQFPGSSVRLLRVEPPFQVLAPGPLENFRLDWRAVRTSQVEEELAALAQHLRAQGRDVEILVRFGDPAEEVLAASAGVDLIVMATQGRGTAGRALFGSVADRVSRYARVPTLLVRSNAAQATPSLGQVVVPLDGSNLAEGALPHAVTLAQTLHVPLRLIRVLYPDHSFDIAAPAAGDRGETDAAAYLEGIAGQLRANGLTVTADVRTGAPALILLGELGPDDLVVVASHGRGGMERWLLGSVAEKLVRHAMGPVLLVHPALAPEPRAIQAG
jgi:nucleotide-binding universal stress UspA family protein